MARSKKTSPTAQHRLEYAAVRVAGSGLRALSPDAASALMGAALGRIMPRTSKHQRALDNLALAMPELDSAARDDTIRRMWRNLGRVAGEAFHIDRILEQPERVILPDNFEHFRALSADGAIMTACHLGNWEVAAILPRLCGLERAGVYQALHNPLVERYLKTMRAAAFPAGLYSKGGNLGQTLIGLARRGTSIGIVADVREKRGIGVNFFGQPAFATPLPAMLARMSGRPIVAGALIRTEGVHFRAFLEHVEVPVTDDREADIAVATQRLHDVYERFIREAPDQWMWTHRKWARSSTRELRIHEPANAQ